MPVVCMLNRKGGVGKTTLTLALADFLSAIHGRSVLVIDMDPQATASIALLGEDDWRVLEETGLTVADLFQHLIQHSGAMEGFQPSLLVELVKRIHGGSGQVNVMASSPRLQDIEDGTADILARRSPYSRSPYTFLRSPTFMRLLGGYDYVLIDCPPSLGMITLNALTVASGYLIPTMSDYISTVALAHVTQRVKQHADGLRREIPLYGTVVTRFRPGASKQLSFLDELRELPQAQPLWDTIIPEAVVASDILNQAAGSMTMKARYGGGGLTAYRAFEALADEFLIRVS